MYRKSIFGAALFSLIISFGTSCSNESNPVTSGLMEPWYEYRFMAHGGGNINGVTASNTIETFNKSYSIGFKIQEIDVCYTSDSACILTRGWWDIDKTMGLDHKPTYTEFMNVLYEGKYHTCDLAYIIDFMKSHKDTYIVVDGSHEVDPTLYTKKILEYSNSDKNILNRLIF